MARNKFLEQIQRAKEASQAPASTPAEKPEEMSDEELQRAVTAARRELLDAQHAELREREIARVQGRGNHETEQRRTFADVLREAKRNTRRRWR